ncbi:FecR domain-containing protein [Pelomonas sp. Root1444]|uniref:FecR family protein n=1 Tax=Pelomonas sp. Root1444 TaxID=1736464 RepID=UPI000702F24E|nr:FecR domain-containing protein [Pelomonas sp. Root1444]KQY88241.1 iron dicitrate transport regulator FecR [Pelomonas sp. Root1444]
MNTSGAGSSRDDPPIDVTPEIAAEAAVWIARLHGPDRSPRMERECLDWQSRSAVHRLAFERCTEVWQAVPQLKLADAYASVSSGTAQADGKRGGRRWGGGWVLAALAAVFAVGAGLAFQLGRETDTYATGVGEQRLVVLDDGTRMSLNTDTRVRVQADRAQRLVRIQSGEALFEVAKDPSRPFVVRAADSEVVALGTVFNVRLAGGGPVDDGLAVTLIEGRVAVRPAAADRRQGIAPAKEVLMQVGERMRLIKASRSGGPATQKMDRPRIDQMLAWKRSEVVFDDAPLVEAVAEMNRYSRVPIVLSGDGYGSRLRVSGLYRTGDSNGFARAVAALHGLRALERDGRLELLPPQ